MTASVLTSEGRVSPSAPRAWRTNGDALAAYVMLAPATLLFTLFIALPIVGTIILSFANWSLLGEPSSAGLSNYAKLLRDQEFLIVLRNTLVYAIGSTLSHIIGGMFLAVGVMKIRSAAVRYFVTTALVIPFLVSSGAIALIARYMLSDDFGPLNYYLRAVGLRPPDWLISEFWAMPALIGVDWWHSVGFTFLIFTVGLQNIPNDYYEAAKLDGAGWLAQFWYVTLPMLSPTTFFAAVVSVIGALQVFTWPYVITNGGPGISTETLAYYVYRQAFQNFHFGYAATVSMCIVLILIGVTLLQFWASRRWVHYDRI